MYLCQDSLLNDPHPICTRAQLDGLEEMEKEVSERNCECRVPRAVVECGQRINSDCVRHDVHCMYKLSTDLVGSDHLYRFCDYLNRLEWEYKYPPRWVPTSCDLEAVVSHRATYPPAEREAMITTTLAFRLVEAVDQITSVAWYPACVQSLILTTGVWTLSTGNETHIRVWGEMAAKSKWVGRVSRRMRFWLI